MTNRALSSLLAVGAVGAVVAVSASGARLIAPPAELSEAQLLTVRVLAAVAVIVGAAGLLVQRKRIRAAARGGADPTVTGVRTAATIMAVVTLVALAFTPPLAAPEERSSRGGPAERAAFGGGAGSGIGSPDQSIGGESLIRGGEIEGGPEMPIVARVEQAEEPSLLRRAAGIVGLVLLLALLAAAIRRLLHTGSSAEEPPVEPGDAERGLVTSIAEVARHGRDPRGQVTAAYERLLVALAAAGAPREPQEAPFEHLRRVLRPLGVRPEPLHRLAHLYIEAQFSERPVTDQHRAAARDALAASLADLRTHAGLTRGAPTARAHAGAVA